MFGGRFNQIKFNIKTDDEIAINEMASFLDFLNSMAGAGKTIDETMYFSDTLKSEGQLATGIVENASFFDVLNSSAIGYISILEVINFQETLISQGYAEKQIFEIIDFFESLKSQGYAEKQIFEICEFQDVLNSAGYLGKQIFETGNFFDVLNSIADSAIKEIHSFTIPITIPPGGELRIDSNNFVVLLNGENIRYLYSGEWIEFDRDLKSLIIATGSGGALQGTVLCQERWL